ncbi:MAG: 50S ribosomal protein L18 [Armatimonadetes bacterium]|nr:50S ribosomal protein L18 [Armatimonadota bacterium]
MADTKRTEARRRRHLRVRKKVEGTPERPRLCVTKTGRHIYAQIIDDWAGRSLAAASTLDAEVRGRLGEHSTKSVEAAKIVGQVVGERAAAAGIKQVVFDRGGWRYHGRIKAVAEGAREAGLDF